MQIIPVIDLQQGLAVHARFGLRHAYLPLHTALCPSSDPIQVVQSFLQLHPFQIIYLADLDAITTIGHHQRFIEKLLHTFPQVTFWVDSGYQSQPSSLVRWTNYRAVLGTESYSNKTLKQLKLFKKKFILSLDFSAQGQPLGASFLFHHHPLWPAQIILMTLARVGGNQGIDVDILHHYQQVTTEIEWIVSGGVRSIEDLHALKKQGIKKVLCASALHHKIISSQQLQQL